jgi:hypothetical protein
LEQENRQLHEQLEEAQRAAAWQAAPFRRPERKKIPEDQKKKPGRKPGHPGAYRAVPTSVDEQAEVPLTACPCCGGPVAQVEAVEQFIEEIPPVRPHVTRTNLESWCDRLLSQRCTQPGDEAIKNRLGKQRESLFGCLYEPAAEPTNNRAERSFRWAVQTRKLSCGNKTETGARCFEVLASVARTCVQRGHDVITYLAGCLPMSVAAYPIPPPASPVGTS